MSIVTAKQLKELVRNIFECVGASEEEISRLQEHLVESNLVGHDSHGIHIISLYIDMIKRGDIQLGAKLDILQESASHAVLDGNWGIGQVMAMKAVEIAIAKAKNNPIIMVTLRNASHIGRLGEYTAKIAEQGFIGFVTVNGHGGAQNVAPWGGIERRLSVNPFSYGIPTASEPIMVDISPTVSATGKVAIKRLRGEKIPLGWVIDHEGKQTTDPNDYFGPPHGSMVPLGGHKGFAMGIVMDIMAGALSGGGCSRPNMEKWGNPVTVIVINPEYFVEKDDYNNEVNNYITYLKSSKLAPGFTEITIPGEPERREKAKREANGIFVEDNTLETLYRLLEDLRINHLKAPL